MDLFESKILKEQTESFPLMLKLKSTKWFQSLGQPENFESSLDEPLVTLPPSRLQMTLPVCVRVFSLQWTLILIRDFSANEMTAW